MFVCLIKYEFYIYDIFYQIGLILCAIRLLIWKNPKRVLLYSFNDFVYIKRREERMFRVGVRKAETQMELNLVRDVKNNKEGFFRYIG